MLACETQTYFRLSLVPPKHNRQPEIRLRSQAKYVRTINLGLYVSNSSTCTINSLLRVVESGSTLSNKFWQILALLLLHLSCMHKICPRFASSWGFVYLVKQSRRSPHEAFHDDATNATEPWIRIKTTGATISKKKTCWRLFILVEGKKQCPS